MFEQSTQCKICGGSPYITVYGAKPITVCSECLDTITRCRDCDALIFDDGHELDDGDLICDDCYDNYPTCDCCDEIIPDDEKVSDGNITLCQNCYDESYTKCDDCDKIISADDAHSDDHISICDNCYNDKYCTCYSCNRIIEYDESYSYDGVYYCERCFDEEFTECDSCHNTYPNDEISYTDDRPYCSDCVDSGDNRIRDYGDTPCFSFHPTEEHGTLYLGVELEIDADSDTDPTPLLDALDGLNAPIWCMHDCSLNHGFEITSHPCTLEFHKDNLPWPDMLKLVSKYGYKSHDTDTCGLHVHLSKDALGDVDEETAKMLLFVSKNWHEIVIFSRRKVAALNRFANKYNMTDQPNRESYIDEAKHAKGAGRYFAVNCTPDSTIEIRFFRGTLKPTTFYAALEFVHALVNFVKTASLNDPNNLTWQKFCSYASMHDIYSNLKQYLEDRHLLVV